MQPLYEVNNPETTEIFKYLRLHFDVQIRYTNHMNVKILQSIAEDSCGNITASTFNVWINSNSALKYNATFHSFLKLKQWVINTRFLQIVFAEIMIVSEKSWNSYLAFQCILKNSDILSKAMHFMQSILSGISEEIYRTSRLFPLRYHWDMLMEF